MSKKELCRLEKWSSRSAHNQEIGGSSPSPATIVPYRVIDAPYASGKTHGIYRSMSLRRKVESNAKLAMGWKFRQTSQ